MFDILLLVVHSNERFDIVKKKFISGNPPDNSHKLASNNGITSICSDAEIEIRRQFFVGNNITESHGFLVKVCRQNFVFEEDIDILEGRGFIEQFLVEQSPVDGIDALRVPVRSQDKNCHGSLPARAYHIADSPYFHLLSGSCDRAWG